MPITLGGRRPAGGGACVGAVGGAELRGRGRSPCPAPVPRRAARGTRRVAVVSQADDPRRRRSRPEHRTFLLGDGERPRPSAPVEELCRAFARWGLTRADVVVAVGGGLVTDVGGFAAATYHRGIAVVHVPTTLLGMIDAAIGGKTGVNLPEGKNLVGAFWQPAAVLCDIDALATLPEREYRSGLGEMAKYHFLTGDDLLALPLEERVAACVAIKAAVVAGDEREAPAGTGATGRASSTTATRSAHALEIAGGLRPAPRRGGGHRPGVRRRAGRGARPHRRRPGRRAPARASPPTASPRRCRPARTPTSWSR